MILKVRQTGRIICQDLKKAKSLRDQFLGLLDPKNPRHLLFNTRFGLHTFFLKEPIDILVLDQNYQIVHLASRVKPNSLVFWHPRYSTVLELKKGEIAQFGLKEGSMLQII